MKNKNNLLVWIGLSICITMWGSSFVITKILLESSVHPSIITFGRYLALTPLVVIIYLSRADKQRIEKKDIKLFVVASLLGTSIFYMLENFGMRYVDSTMGALIVGISPVLVAIYEVVFNKTKMSSRQVAGILLSVVGILIFSINKLEVNNEGIIGIVLMLLATTSWVSYVVLSKKLTVKYSGKTILTYQALVALVSLSPTMLNPNLDFAPLFNIKVITLIAIQGFLVSGLGYFLYLQAIKYLGPIRSTMAQNLTPFVTLVVSYFVLGEQISITNLVGVTIVIFGLFMLSKSTNKEEVKE